MKEELVCICSMGKEKAPAISRAIDLLGEAEEILPRRGDDVLIKPNLGWNKTWQTGTTTNPHFISALVDIIDKRDPSSIIVGESPSIGMVGEDVFRETGYDRLRDRGVEIRDLGKDPTFTIDLPGDSLLKHVDLPESYRSADYVINVPVIKTHVNTCVTIACKNLKGLLPSGEKKRFHFLGLDRCIAELVSVVRNDLVIVDGGVGQEGLGPISGMPVEIGAIIAGTNPVAVDATCINAMGIELSRVKHLEIAMGMGLCPEQRGIRVIGDRPPRLFRPFKLPPENFSGAYRGVNIIQGNACSGCIGALTVSLERMSEAGELDTLAETIGCINIALGPEAEVKGTEGNWILMGNCLRNQAHMGRFVPGCSPQGWYVRDVIRSLIGLPPLFVDESLLGEGEENVTGRNGE
jgi:uncharacterized protein (DUF362 family)